MRGSALLREVWQDIRTGTAWTVIFTLLSTVLVTGVAAADVVVVSRLNAQAQHFRSVMASVLVLEQPQKIDAQACMALSHLPGVHAAAAVRTNAPQAKANVLPSSAIRTYEATPGVERLLRVPAHDRATSKDAPTQQGVYLSQAVAETLGAKVGQPVRLDDHDVTVLGIFPWKEEDGRRPGFAYSMFSPTPPVGTFDECWVDTWPMNPDLDPLIRSALLPSDDFSQPAKLYSFNGSLGASFNGLSLMQSRITVLVPSIVVVAGLLLGAASVWRRRLEYASDLHAGVARRDLVAKFAWETAAWVVASLVIALPIMTWFIVRNPVPDQGEMWQLAFTHLLGGACTSMLGAMVSTLLIREKHLLRYFKHR